ncbi:hypothetical protein LINPERPRIM_LOCUS23333, partial [Linum perenne]
RNGGLEKKPIEQVNSHIHVGFDFVSSFFLKPSIPMFSISISLLHRISDPKPNSTAFENIIFCGDHRNGGLRKKPMNKLLPDLLGIMILLVCFFLKPSIPLISIGTMTWIVERSE